MRRLLWSTTIGSVVIALTLVRLGIGPSVTAQDATPDPVSELQTTVADLSSTVSGQSTQISELQTQVAELPIGLATPIATPEPRDLTITIELSAKPADLDASTEGKPCAGAGKSADLGPDTEIAIYDADEELLVTGKLIDSTLPRAGTIFSDCKLEFVIEDIPFETDYILVISHRSVMTLSYEELEELEWLLVLHFGP